MPQRHIHPAPPSPGLPGVHCPLYTLPDNACAKQANPPITILRHRLRFGRNAASSPLQLAPLLPALRRAWPGQILRLIFVKGLLRPEFWILIDSSGPSKSIRGFNGSVIAIYLY